MIQKGDLIYLTKNIKLACALATMGHNLRCEDSCVIEENGKQEVTFCFDNKGGLVSADAKKWDAGLDKMDPDEPMAYLWTYAHNRDRILDMIKKSVPLVRVKSNGKILLYSKNSSLESRKKIMEKL